MATWIMHLRVAEKLLNQTALAEFFKDIDEKAYYVGSIAPDSGTMVGEFTYIPPKDTSHWKRDEVSYDQRFLDNREFYVKYYLDEPDLFKKSLFLGYYLHILTDTIYVRDIIHPYIDKMGKPFWRENILGIRKGWYEIDFRFIANNPNYRPFALLKEVKPFENSYLDYFGKTDIYNRVQNAIELYSNPKTDPKCEFFTHPEEYTDELIDKMVDEISQFVLNNK
ncbi:MAG: hypothetical protein E7586_04950 [Ruminococcaceae bacterium]|nr:hypothetical protein [Oscillospiraceae bacterium]